MLCSLMILLSMYAPRSMPKIKTRSSGTILKPLPSSATLEPNLTLQRVLRSDDAATRAATKQFFAAANIQIPVEKYKEAKRVRILLRSNEADDDGAESEVILVQKLFCQMSIHFVKGGQIICPN